jgi:hypothetical protein
MFLLICFLVTDKKAVVAAVGKDVEVDLAK